tara:strand:+ start:90315 stop:91187 length:873 start_codon:yes stop_codon:yes gene_type:complete
MRLIDSYFSATANRTLYHYTGVGSLMGIANAKSIWASNVYYMNDSKEIVHACDILKKVLLPRIAFGVIDSPENVFLKQLQDWIDSCRTTIYNIFVFSLSEEPSLLSQWRSYTPHGKGVSVGFSDHLLSSIAQDSDLRIAKCIYNLEEQRELLGSLIEELLVKFRQKQTTIDTSNSHPSQCYHPFLEEFRGDVLQVLSVIKHHAFEEEREWRLISNYFPKYTIPSIKFREGASMLIPYIEINLGENKPYFQQVVLGPSPHQNLSMSALSMFLSNQNLCEKTSNCAIPYREW